MKTSFKLYVYACVYLCFLGLIPATSFADDTVLLPSPCRLLDTRVTNQRLSAGYTMTFTARGTPSSQGGESSCAIPHYATGAILNIIAVSPDATGYARIWEWPRNSPLATTLMLTGQENSNMEGFFPLTLSGSIADFELYTTTGSHYVVEVVGWTTNCPMYEEYKADLPSCSVACLSPSIMMANTNDRLRDVQACFQWLTFHGDATDCGSAGSVCRPG